MELIGKPVYIPSGWNCGVEDFIMLQGFRKPAFFPRSSLDRHDPPGPIGHLRKVSLWKVSTPNVSKRPHLRRAKGKIQLPTLKLAHLIVPPVDMQMAFETRVTFFLKLNQSLGQPCKRASSPYSWVGSRFTLREAITSSVSNSLWSGWICPRSPVPHSCHQLRRSSKPDVAAAQQLPPHMQNSTGITPKVNFTILGAKQRCWKSSQWAPP